MEEGSAPTFWKRTGNLIVSVMDRTQRAMNRGRGKGDGNSNGGKSKKSRIPQGEKEMSTFLNNAQYEISQDPYRGLQSQQQSLETGTDITTPWNACCWGTLRPESATIKTVDSTAVVRHVGHCACPSLKAWTKTSKENNNKKKKGRKRGRQAATSPSLEEVFDIGTRPRDPNFRCLCDYNPLCLGTLGGVINDILIERSKDTEVIESSLTPEEECPAKKPQHEQRGTSILESLPIAKDCSSNEQDKNEEKGIILGQLEDTEQNDKVFDFLDERRDPVVKLKPLVDIERERIKRPPENPANVFVSDISKIDSIDIKYSSATADLLKGLRHSIHSDATTIRSYAHQTLGLNDDQPMDRTSTWTVDKYIDILNKWQKSLRFENPIRDVDEVQEAYDDPIIISIPPGIENLGATCYLNTQLQCLAQNPAFLNGIFSWRLVNSNHNMNSVMSKMQLLLAQMVLGGESKLSTLDFSNALGIEHDEQQDPNEFARLLFERMDESFQQCDNDGNLANLLQRNFHGITTYETICMTCTHSSERSEGFMDLNLPIAQREKQDDRKTTKKDITHYFGSKSVDTDVQYCLDQYTHAEVLDGDNQYFCSACNCKRDAKRVLKLTELPPILNVQLSRYVFDRTQFVKKKLSDKVLLPKTLQVPMSSGSKKDYVLCAVMRHQGTSAYRGHYVAEAMDWLTGQWFEFNDETVKLLSDGPSCSYDPAETEISEAKMSSLTGSQDAYNMYYVDENFLSKNALDDLSHKESLCTVDTKIIEDENNNVLAEVSKQRRAKYATLSKMCFTDGQTADRLGRRKLGIRNYMFEDAVSLVPESPREVRNEDSFVWVEADFLRKFLSLENVLDENFRSPGPLLKHKHLLCEHGQLHPKIARKGKLLPRSLYDVYVSLLRGEQLLLRKQSRLIYDKEDEINDCIITPSKNLICDTCSQSYRNDLKGKLDHLRNIKDLYHFLDSSLDEKPEYYHEEENPICPEDAFVYIISKKMATLYKNAVKALMKTLAKVEEGAVLDNETLRGSNNSVFEGIDSIDLSAFQGDFIVTMDSKRVKQKKDSGPKEMLDKFFNQSITCKHGNCNSSNHTRIRFISWEGWQKVKKVFPKAIELTKKRTIKVTGNPGVDGCPECNMERLSFERLQGDLEKWAKETHEDVELKNLVDGTVSREIEARNFKRAQSGCRLVHRADIDSWRSTLKALKRKTKLIDSKDLKAFVENIAFPSYHSVVLEFERQPIEKAVTSLRSLVCREHRLVIESAIFFINSESTDTKQSHLLSDHIVVLLDEEYSAYISSLAGLLRVLNPEEEDGMEIGSIGSPVLIDTDKSLLNDILRITDSYHPRIKEIRGQEKPEDILLLSCDGSTKEFVLSPAGVCRCETCKKEFAPLLLPSNNDDDKIESISVDSNESKSDRIKKQEASGSESADPILVESDIDDTFTRGPATFPLRVFEVKDDSSLQEALDSLKEASALPRENSVLQNQFLRRSSRSHKSRYPVGCLLSENSVNVGLHHNMAALRLLLYEKCEVGLSGRKLTLVLPCVIPPKTCEIKFEWGQKSLHELFDEMSGLVDKSEGQQATPSTDLLLLYQKESNGQSSTFNATVMDSLLQLANLEAGSTDNQAKNKKRRRSSERGFQGTLLHSSLPSTNNHNRYLPEAKTPAKSDVSAVSDEEKYAKSTMEDPSPSKKITRFVLSESDNSDDEILKKTLFSPKPRNPKEFNHTEMIIEQSESSNGEEENDQLLNRNSIPSGIPDGHQVAITIEESEEEKLQSDISQSLAMLIGQDVDQSKCWDATVWAIKNNGTGTTKSAVLDSAFAKYLSET